jgi:transcriptional regulator with GAF, ATPase, and Fis domain
METLLLGVWREACRHIDIDRSLERIAGLVAAHIPADLLLVRRVDAGRSLVETVAAGACRPGVELPLHPRTECSRLEMNEIFSWGRDTGVSRWRIGETVPVPTALVPDGLTGAVIAGPLRNEIGMSGVLLASARADRFDASHEALTRALLEPLGVALANDARIHELARLREALEADKRALLSRLNRQDVTDAVVGATAGLRDVMERVEQVAHTDTPVLIYGETGAGKEVVARAVHSRSRRATGPIVRVNCGAIPAGLVDSELFGHERGSFTGAVSTRQGWFERADGGTLFLDEVGELPLEAQVRLLRILQDGTFERVGGSRTLRVDVRIVAATHRNLQEMVAQGTFRQDLWYRIGTFPIVLPPLRERPEDVPLLAAHFAARAGARLGAGPLTLTRADTLMLQDYPWPGNVRELAAVIERAAILGGGRELRIAAALGVGDAAAGPATSATVRRSPPQAATLDAAMRDHIERALESAQGRIEGPGGAAARLAVNPHTLRARMRKLGIDWRAFRARGASAAAVHDEPVEVAAFEDAMRLHIEAALRATRGRVEGPRGVAARLGINPHTLRARMRRLGIDWRRYRVSAPR